MSALPRQRDARSADHRRAVGPGGICVPDLRRPRDARDAQVPIRQAPLGGPRAVRANHFAGHRLPT